MKLRKIIASATLSVCLATSAVIATTGLNKAGAYAATQTVNTSGIASTVTASGNNASVSYEQDIDAKGKTFTGLKLTGSTGATFDLGTIDLKKSYWNGADMTFGTEKPASSLSDAAKADMQLKGDGETVDYNKFSYDESTGNLLGKYYNGSDTFQNFIAFAFAPTLNRYGYGQDPGNGSNKITYDELVTLDITLTDGDGNTLTITTKQQTDGNTDSRDLGVYGDGQKYGGMRKFGSTGPRLYGLLRVKMSGAGGDKQVPYELCYNQNWSAANDAENNPALYSPNGSGAAGTIAGTWLLRKFAKTSYVDNALGDTKAWNGFSSSEVNVTVKFSNVRTLTGINGEEGMSNNGITSLVITSLGGYDLTVPTQEIDTSVGGKLQISGENPANVAVGDEVTVKAPKQTRRFGGSYATNAVTEVYHAGKKVDELAYTDSGESTKKLSFNKEGVYTLKHKVGDNTVTETVKCAGSQTYSVSTLASMFTVSEGGTAAYGAKTIHNVNGKSTEATYKGIVLTGGNGATFTLNKEIDVTSFKWNGKDDFDTLFDFVIAPSGKTLAKGTKNDGSEWTMQLRELQSLSFIIEDAEDSSQKIIVKYSPGEFYEDRTPPKSSVGAAATGQKFLAFRQVQGGKVVNAYLSSVPKETGFNGTAVKPTSIVYDYSANSVYSDVVYTSATGDSYLIRDFDDASAGDVLWGGFNSGKVKISVQFGNLTVIGQEIVMNEGYISSVGLTGTPVTARADDTDLTETSVVLTNIAGYDLSEETFSVSHENDKVTYFNQDGTLFDGGNLTYTVNDEILLPNVMQSNFLLGNVDFAGYYEFAAPNGTVIASGEYQNNGVIPATALTANGRGVYTLTLTDAYNRAVTVNYQVGSILTAEVNDKFALYLNGKKYVDGDEIVVFNDNVIVRVELKEGYELKGYNLDGGAYNLVDGCVEASAVTNKNVLKPQVSAIEYKVTYKYFDTTITETPDDQIFTVETRDTLALTVPTLEGKSFTGWYLDGKKITSLKDLVLKDVTLTGAFGEKRITFTFVVDGEETYRYKFDGADMSGYVPEKEGYVFEGWVDGDGNAVNLETVTADVKVYAKFTPAGETATGDKETAAINDGEANVIDADIKEPYYIGVVELVSFGIAIIGLAGVIAGLIFFLKSRKGVKAANANNNENEGEQK